MPLRFLDDPPPPPPSWLVPGWVPSVGLTVLAGPPGAGKSALAVELVSAALQGGPWLGLPVTEGGAVLWAAWEAHPSTEGRLRALLPESAAIGVLSSPPLLQELDALERLIWAVDRVAARFERPVRVVVVDSLTSATRGIDENSGKEMGAAIGRLLELAEARDVVVLLLSHTPKDGDGRTRGHGVVDGDASAVLALSASGSARKITARKMRDGELPAPLGFRIVAEGEHLRAVPASEGPASTSRDAPALPRDAAAALDALRTLNANGTSPVPLEAWREATMPAFAGRTGGASREAWRKAKAALSERGLVAIDGASVTVTERH